MNIRPHQISVPDEVLDDTRDRLKRTRWSPEVSGADDRYGIDMRLLRQVVDYWAESYDWRAAEAALNSRPHYLTEIDGIDVHFWHIESEDPQAIPLVLLHGWPGSVIEFFDLIDSLSAPAEVGAESPSFNLVIPEIPGFGFGGKPTEPGWGPNRIADALDTLVHDRLGYARYGVQGGDWGSLIGARIARRHPDHVAAFHSNFPFTGPHGDHVPTPEWGANFQAITGYLHVQSLVPDAFTIGLDDSPVGTAAWILEKFASWSDSSGDVVSTFGLDRLLTNIGFYWYGRSLASATRLYRESAIEEATEGAPVIGPPQIPVPTGIAAFPHEPYLSPREWLEGVYTITHWRDFSSGGHFAALEQPQELLTEIRDFFPQHFATTTSEEIR